MIPRQQELFTGRPVHKNVAWLEELLLEAGGWLTAAEILQKISFKPTDDNKRYIRDLANQSKVVLSGPGSPGYRHLKGSTIDEAKHYANAQISQGREMVHRGIRILRSAHELLASAECGVRSAE